MFKCLLCGSDGTWVGNSDHVCSGGHINRLTWKTRDFLESHRRVDVNEGFDYDDPWGLQYLLGIGKHNTVDPPPAPPFPVGDAPAGVHVAPPPPADPPPRAQVQHPPGLQPLNHAAELRELRGVISADLRDLRGAVDAAAADLRELRDGVNQVAAELRDLRAVVAELRAVSGPPPLQVQ